MSAMQQMERELLHAFVLDRPDEVARLVERAPHDVAATVLGDLEVSQASAVVQHMTPVAAARCVSSAAGEWASRLLDELDVDAAARLLRRVEEPLRQNLLSRMESNAAVGRLLQYPPDTAGALVDPLVLALPRAISVGEALERVRIEPQNSMYYVYVVEDDQRLTGVVNLRELMLAPPDQELRSIMRSGPDAIEALAGKQAIASHPAWRRVHALPVVDRAGGLVGAIRYEIVRRIEHELGRSTPRQNRAATAQALAELYGLGAAGVVEWAAAALKGPDGPGRRRKP